MQSDLVVLAGRAGQAQRRGEFGAGARRVIPQEIDCLAHLGQGRRDRASAFADDQRNQGGAISLIEIGRLFQYGGALFGRGAAPGRRGGCGAGKRLLDRIRTGGGDGADPAPPVARIEHRCFGSGQLRAADDRPGMSRLPQGFS